MCRPKFIPYEKEYKDSSLLDIKQLRHPCVSLTHTFVPNDTLLDPGNS